MNLQISNAIKLLRFPLAFMIVVWHGNFSGCVSTECLPVFNFVCTFFSGVLVCFAVPCFFVISGYLFFANVSCFDLSMYKRKLRSRARSLLVPYLFWTVLLLFLYWIADINGISIKIAAGKSVSDFSILDFFSAFINVKSITGEPPLWYSALTGGGTPFFIPLWFIRNLMACVLLTPIIYFIISKIRWWISVLFIIVIMSILVACKIANDYNYSISIMWFVIGASLSIHRINLTKLVGQYWIVGIWLLFALANSILPWLNFGWLINEVTNILGIVAIFTIAIGVATIEKYINLMNSGVLQLLNESTFFIFATHFYIIAPIVSRIGAYLPNNDFIYTVVYILLPILVTMFCVMAFTIIRKIFPKFTAIICGNRC